MVSVKRIVPNVATPDPALAHTFYGELLGLDLRMDMGWIRTYVGQDHATQVSFMSEGGSDTPVPDLSIEVDGIDPVLESMRQAGVEIVYGPVLEPWGVRRFFVRDPFGKLVNILEHAEGSAR